MESNSILSEAPAHVYSAAPVAPGCADSSPWPAMLRARPREGLLLGNVLLKRKVSEGRTGAVYQGWHTRLKIPVLVKVIDEARPNVPLFLRAACRTVSVDHPNLARVLDVNMEPHSGLCYAVTEFIEGSTVSQLLERQLAEHGRALKQSDAVKLALAVAQALGAAHEAGIAHGRVKLENILVRLRDGAVKLAGLGFPSTDTEDASPAGDVYALGAALYELLIGHIPSGESQDQACAADALDLRPDLDAEVSAVVRRCLEPQPQRRYANGGELAEALERALHRLGGTSQPQPNAVDESGLEGRPVVLCVDGNEGILKLMRRIMEGKGFTPTPGQSGSQLCKGLREANGCQELDVLMLDDDDDSGTALEALECAILGHLAAQAGSQDLVMRVRLLSKLRALDRERKVIEIQVLKTKNIRAGEVTSSPRPTSTSGRLRKPA